MSYTPSPRPSFDQPTYIAYEQTRRHMWGDPIAGEVADWIYVSSDKIHQLVFGLPRAGMFRHSDAHRTVFASDELYYVLSGELLIANPETGEVQRALPGEAIFFRRDTWHHAMNGSDQPLRVLEYFAPPPSQGTSGTYSRTKPLLTAASYTQDRWLTQWPMAQHEAQQSASMRVVREADLLWRLEGRDQPTPIGLLCSTEHLTVGTIRLLPGQQTEPHRHAGDECLYVVSGEVHVRLPEQRELGWFELTPGDGFYLPQGVLHQYHNGGRSQAQIVFGVAPNYLPEPQS